MNDLMRQIETALPQDLPKKLGVAVSGGSDLVALLLLLRRISAARGCRLFCVTVDHGLRPEAASEAAWVAGLCASHSVPHETLTWTGWDGAGNTQNAAREARYGLMAEWAARNGISAIALGHTRDDQAETVLMELARGAGVDGLSAMTPARNWLGVTWLRPLLAVGRNDLRAFLNSEGVIWQEDPSNSDERFDRIKARKALAALAPLGVDAARLGMVAVNMHKARAALDHQTRAAAEAIVELRAGAVKIDKAGFDALPGELARRLIVGSVKWISGAPHAPRGRSVAAALEALRDKRSATLSGCRLLMKSNAIWVFREHNAVRDHAVIPSSLWDGRWRLVGPIDAEMTVAALGSKGLVECPDWRATGLPRALLLAAPAVWREDHLIAAPHAGRLDGWTAELQNPETSFFDGLISH